MAAAVVAVVVGAGLLPSTAVASSMATPGDFNGDGYRDQVISAPGRAVSGKESAGAVVVLYGSASGLAPTRRAVITQDSAGVPGASEPWDGFGNSTAVADLDRDGFADLVVGTPYEDMSGITNAGMLTVLWGSRNGLTSGSTLQHKLLENAYVGYDVAAVKGGTTATTRVLAASWQGSFEYAGPFGRNGTIGSSSFNQMTPGQLSVALGDVDRKDGADKFLFTYRLGGEGGRVYVNASSTGSIPGPYLTKGDGLVGAVGDVNGDGYGDLVVGDPDEPWYAGEDDEGALGGRVSVWFGSATGIALDAQPQHISQDTPGIPGAGEKYDKFGDSLAVADLNRDGAAEIIVGVPNEGLGNAGGAGNVVIIPGRKTGALGTGAYSVNQETASVPGGSEDEDQFATTVAAGDVNKDGRPELMVSAIGENNRQGAFWVLPGGTAGPTGTGSKMMLPSSLGLSQSDWVALGGYGLSLDT